MVLLSASEIQAQTTAYQFKTTDGNFWKMSSLTLSDKVPGKAQVVIRSSQPQQTFLGWGTCFNELPWDAYNLLSDNDKQLLVKRMFNPYGDLRLQKGRLSAGANDYAREWYSCDEIDVNETDFEMEHFNIDRDLTTIIPSIKLALAENPEIDFFCSPWSPPTWMKTNKHYAQRKTNTNGCPFNVPPYFNDQFIDDPRYYKAYCLYFDKFINAYKEQGINITSLAYQNEAYSNTPYPGCSWTAKTTGKFLAEYLGPYMREHQPNLKLIIGTMNTGSLDVYEQILSTPNIDKYMDAIGFQWEGANAMKEILRRHPQYEAIQTENECGSGTFDWNAGAHTFQLANHYLANKVTTYYYWNAILKDNGISPWGWIQNAMVQVNSGTKTPRYTPEYYAYCHYTHFIPAGSKILTTDESQLVTTALTPEGNIVIVAGNDGSSEKTLTLDIDGKYMVATLPAKSFNTYVVGQNEKAQLEFLRKEAQGLVEIETASLSETQLTNLKEALSKAKQTIAESDSAQIIQSLANAVIDVRKDTKTQELSNEIQNPSFTDGSTHWTIANKAAGGDFKTATIAGKTCWNNWSNNFTSMDIHQDLGNLKPGAYTLSAISMCGPGEITNQHAYAEAQSDKTISPIKEVAIWNQTTGWEKQTTEPIVVGTDGTLRIGYSSTSGGGTKGWFCVSDFTLNQIEDDAELIQNAIDAAIKKAEAQEDNSLSELITTAKNAVGREAQLEALTLLRESLKSGTDLTEILEQYKALSEEAHNIAKDEKYADQARQELETQTELYDQWIEAGKQVSEPSIKDVIRALKEMINKTRLSQVPSPSTDFTYYIKNADAEDSEGWDINVTNGDGSRKSGQHYSGNTTNMYFDSFNQTAGSLWFTGHQTLTDLPNGVYTLKACARTDGEAVFLTAQTESDWYQQEIENSGNTQGKLGKGWNPCEIQNIIVRNHTLTIGYTNDFYLTGKKFTGTWMSFDDFQLYYVSDNVSTSIGLPSSSTPIPNIKGGKGCIIVTSDVPVKVYNLNGMLMGRTQNLPAGIYAVIMGNICTKVIVK